MLARFVLCKTRPAFICAHYDWHLCLVEALSHGVTFAWAAHVTASAASLFVSHTGI